MRPMRAISPSVVGAGGRHIHLVLSVRLDLRGRSAASPADREIANDLQRAGDLLRERIDQPPSAATKNRPP
jgi:hypothetical protein